MAYEVTEEQIDAATASLGALVSNVTTRARGVDTTIRVGSAKFDNYHPYQGSRGEFTVFTPLSLNDDENQIRRTLWAESDRVYRLASRRLLQLNTDEQLLAEQSQKDADFSSEPAQSYSRLPEKYGYDRAALAEKLRSWSAEFKKHPKILTSRVTFREQREIKTFVNTEGGAIQLGSNLFRLEIDGSALARRRHGNGRFHRD